MEGSRLRKNLMLVCIGQSEDDAHKNLTFLVNIICWCDFGLPTFLKNISAIDLIEKRW